MEWQMIKSDHFYIEERGYIVDLYPFCSFYPTWTIIKDGIIIDRAQHHSPVTSDCNKELAAKAQIEKILKELP